LPLELPKGTACFVDSNIFYYALVPTAGLSEHCTAFLNRAIAGEIIVWASIPVLSDAIHKVMTAEAAARLGRDRQGIVGYLGRHPEVVNGLTEYLRAVPRLRTVPINLIAADLELLETATAVSQEYGLLSNDAIIVAQMRKNGLVHLVTNDDDFDAIPGLRIWKPRK
jgi:predicted nucleic acid-binding protein